MLQFDEQKDQVAVEQILRVVFLDAEGSSPVSPSQASSFLSQCKFWGNSNFGLHISKLFLEANGQTQAPAC
jgi:hypothetical protein